MDLFSAVVETILILLTFFSLALIISFTAYKIKSRRKKKIDAKFKTFRDLCDELDYYEILNTPIVEEEKIKREKKFFVVNNKEVSSPAS
jgi:hypothetical protein